LQRAQDKKNRAGLFSNDLKAAAKEERDIQKAALQAQYELDMANINLTDEQKLALKRKLDADMRKIDQDYLDWSQMTNAQRFAFVAEQAAQGVQVLADFAKRGTDKELAQLDKGKKAKLANLEAEYKAGAISKDKYEAQKAAIEANYDEKTRALKKQAADKEKAYNVAQAVIQTALSIVKASPNVPLMVAAGVTGAASIAKIIATPIPEFEQGGVFGRKPSLANRIGQAAGRAWRGVKEYAWGGRINTTAGVANVGQRHSGGGIRMVDGATGEHLGEWERGEAYMILSRDTYANNKHLVDELIDTSLYRGGAPVRQQAGYFEAGGTFAPLPSAPSGSSTATSSQELIQAVLETRDAVRALPGRIQAFIDWNQDDTASLEEALNERAADRAQGEVK